jgi:ATP-dependent DNA helicase RecG
MNQADLERLIAGGESETLEFKQSTAQLPRAGETLCAFLNAAGGTIVIGVTPDGKLVGQQVADKTQQEIATMLRRFEPPANVELEFITLEGGRQAIVFQATPAGEAMPFTYDGRPYQRIGATTSIMPQERYQRLLLERMHARRRWENEPAEGYTLDDLDQEEILRTAREGIAARRLPERTKTDPADILDRLGVRVQGQLFNAAIVLFGAGARFLPDYPQCHLRLARFKGTTKAAFLDNRQFHGHAFEVLNEAMLFLDRHLPIAGRFEPGRLERIDEPLFPTAALREALVNAICHRDYVHAGGAISLAIYDDRLEIWSEGTLPFGLRAEDLKRNHRSRPRNPLIAGTFFRRGLVESWGRGTQMIVEQCVQAGHPEPEFLEEAGAVGVLFLPKGYIAPHRAVYDLSALQREILQVLAQQPAIPLRELYSRLAAPPSERTVQRELADLIRLGLADSGGRSRGTRYWLRSSGHEQARIATD